MTRLSERIIAAMLTLFLLAYVGYQAFRYYYSPLQLEGVFNYTVFHSINVSGVAVREEMAIQHPSGGIKSFVPEDGERVSIGQTVVEFYQSDVSDRQVKRMRELQQEIDMLTEAQNPAVSNFSNAESLGRDIRGKLGELTQMAGTGRFFGAQNIKETVTSLLNKRQVAIGKEVNYATRIAALQAEYDQLSASSVAKSLEVAEAPVSGYFVREADGLEGVLTPDKLGSLDVAGYREMIEMAQNPPGSPGTVGRIVTSQNWYFLALAPKYNIQDVRKGWTVSITFDTADETIPGVVEEILQENEDELSAMIIRCDYIAGDLLSMRATNADIRFEQFAGLRVNTDSIRMVDDTRGVYVLSNKTVEFKRIDPIYEEQGFVISRPYEDLTDGEKEAEKDQEYDRVKRFDQVITKGRDLYHGKVIE